MSHPVDYYLKVHAVQVHGTAIPDDGKGPVQMPMADLHFGPQVLRHDIIYRNQTNS